SLLQVFHDSLAEVRSLQTESEPWVDALEVLVVGAGKLSAVLATAERVTRARIGGSHLHMTASRLGLRNEEEVYLSSLLTTTLREARTHGREDLSWIGGQAYRESTGEPADLLPSALALMDRNQGGASL